MTPKVQAVRPETPLTDVARFLADGQFGAAPVVGPDGEPLGIVTETDVMGALLDGSYEDQRARDVMTAKVISIDEFAPADEVMRLLRDAQIHHLLVLRSGRIVGIVTPGDVVRFFATEVLEPDGASA
jgi:CBS domain-containing protein